MRISEELSIPEYHFHILGPAPPAHPPLHVSVTGGGDEVVALTRLELHLLGGGGEGSEGDGEVHQVPGLVTHSNDPGVGLDDGAGVELLLLDAVDDVSLSGVDPSGTDDVHLQGILSEESSHELITLFGS